MSIEKIKSSEISNMTQCTSLQHDLSISKDMTGELSRCQNLTVDGSKFCKVHEGLNDPYKRYQLTLSDVLLLKQCAFKSQTIKEGQTLASAEYPRSCDRLALDGGYCYSHSPHHRQPFF